MAMASTKSIMSPLAFFWDIENCQIPVTKSAFDVVQRLRDQFGNNYAEVEFIVVCDVTKERADVVEDLNAAQVTVIHVKALAKNACDDKLRTSMTKFSMSYQAPGVVVLISSDVNFAHALTDLRYRCGFRVVLLHNGQVSNSLVMTSNEHFDWQSDILASISDRPTAAVATPSRPYKISVHNLPHMDETRVRDRLKQLCDNCGGRVLDVDFAAKSARISFVTADSAMRAQKRMNGSNVFGKIISVRLCKTDGRPPPSWSANVALPGSSSAPLHHSSTAPAAFSFISRSEIVHHFTTTQPDRAVVEITPSTETVRIIETQEEEEETSTNSASDVIELSVMPNYNGNNNGMTAAASRNLTNEEERLKRILGVGNYRERVESSSTDDDGFDFTPVKLNSGTSTQPVGGRRSRNNSTSAVQQSIPSSDRPSPSSKPRMLERFAREAVELLRGSPQCQILMARFAAIWCTHFSRPIRLAEFGCSKLTELITEVSDTLQIVEFQGVKYVTLVPQLLKTSLQDQIVSVLRQQPFRRAQIDRLLDFYQFSFGYALNLHAFGYDSIDEALASMQEVMEVEANEDGTRSVSLIEFRHRQMLANQLLYMFIRCPERRLAGWQLENEFRTEFGVDVSFGDVKNLLDDFVSITEYDADTVYIELNSIQRLALRLRRILVTNGGELPLHELEHMYLRTYGERILLADGTTSSSSRSVLGIMRSASHVLYVKGRGGGSYSVCINRNFLSSLKDLKPDLFIPPETSKSRKSQRTNGNYHGGRSVSHPRNGNKEKSMDSLEGLSGNVVLTDKDGRPLQWKHHCEAKKRAKADNRKPSVSPTEYSDDYGHEHAMISATSTPPETNGFGADHRIKRAPPPPSNPNVVLAGLGALPKLVPPKSVGFVLPQLSTIAGPSTSSVFDNVHEQQSKDDHKFKMEKPSTAAENIPVRRSRLAANFAALAMKKD